MEKIIEFICPECSGSGIISYEEPNGRELCPTCNSSGSLFLDEDDGNKKGYLSLNEYLDSIEEQ